MEKLVSDTGVIRVIVREVRDNLNDIPLGLLWWQRQYQTEPYRVAQGIASALDGGAGRPATINYWYSKTKTCIDDGLALASFVGTKTEDGWKYGAPQSVLLALPDAMDRTRCVLLHSSRDAFGGEEGEKIMLGWAREWAAAMGRRLMQEKVTVEWVPV